MHSNYAFYFGATPENTDQLSRPELEEQLLDQVKSKYENKEKDVGAEMMRWYERMVMLQIMDQQWKDHLLALDHLKEGIGLRGYGQRDPLVEYKRESFGLFEELWNRATEEMVRMLFLLRPITENDERELLTARQRKQEVTYSGPEQTSSPAFRPNQPVDDRTAAAVKTVVRNNPKVGRNDPCSCGSGKKYKKCCGQ